MKWLRPTSTKWFILACIWLVVGFWDHSTEMVVGFWVSLATSDVLHLIEKRTTAPTIRDVEEA